ncbi:MAG: TolC family protein, partial [Novosphingobium sp.]
MRLSRLTLLAGMALAATPALADDLREALTLAYTGNPQLQAARAQQRAVDEGVPIARSATLPSVSGGASYTEFLHTSGSSPLAPDRNLALSVDLGVPIYAGGAIK